MDVVAERFIELVAIQHYRELDQEELKEFAESYKYLVRRQWEIAKIRKLICKPGMGDGWQSCMTG